MKRYMVTGVVGLSTQATHKSVITAASFSLSDYDANIILNKETIPMTGTGGRKRSGVQKRESIEAVWAEGDADGEVASAR